VPQACRSAPRRALSRGVLTKVVADKRDRPADQDYSVQENVFHHEETKTTKKQGKAFVFFVSSWFYFS
jgi:hypothetical protein